MNTQPTMSKTIQAMQALGLFADVGSDGVKAYWAALEASKRLGDTWGVLSMDASTFALYWHAIYNLRSTNR